MKQRFLIRYNTTSVSDNDRWRIIVNGKEILVSDIHINVPCYTSRDEMPGVGLKFHIACEGKLAIKGTIAEING